MWNGKKKAVTFSYDDGVMQDIRLIEIFNRYGLRATFNLNSGLLGGKNTLIRGGVQLKEGEIVSVRGMGKFRFAGSGGLSKKGRLYVYADKYV